MSIKGCKRVTENIWSPWVKSDAGIKKGRSIKISKLLIMAACTLLTSGCTPGEGSKSDIPPMAITPSPLQVEYQQMEVIGFLHFSINTFTGREWGYGDESPDLFNPSEADVEQWVITAKKGGIKELILTAKHHDGFCLWPSAYTEHSIRNSPYMNGEGDLVAEFTDACRKHGIKPGLYLSPWDRNHRDYGRPEYIEYYRNQIRELLTNYGNINEIWFDGANGGDGYYGGANEIRVIERERYYDWENTFKLVKELQPEIMIRSKVTGFLCFSVMVAVVTESPAAQYESLLSSIMFSGEKALPPICWLVARTDAPVVKSILKVASIIWRNSIRAATSFSWITPRLSGGIFSSITAFLPTDL